MDNASDSDSEDRWFESSRLHDEIYRFGGVYIMKFKNGWHTCIEFIADKWRYFLAAVVFGLIVLILAFVVSKKTTQDEDISGVYKDFQVDANVELNALIVNYYNAYASGDTNALSAYASPISDAEASFIKFMSQFIEAYNVVNVYSKQGLDDGSYLVSVHVKEKFVGINTPASGLDFFYVRTNENGMLYIDNSYGSYNQKENETSQDPKIQEIIEIYNERNDVMKLKKMVEDELAEALKSDAQLNQFLTETIRTKIGEWKAQYKAQREQQKAIADAKAKEAADAAAKAQQDAQAAALKAQQDAMEEANATTVVITEKVNVRDSASEAGNIVGTLDGGTPVKKYAEENGFTKIDYNGAKAFVKSDYVAAANQPAAQPEVQPQPATNNVTLTNTVNVRGSKDENGERVAVGVPGDTVTVLGDAGDGWSRVSIKGIEGYMKTEFIH